MLLYYPLQFFLTQLTQDHVMELLSYVSLFETVIFLLFLSLFQTFLDGHLQDLFIVLVSDISHEPTCDRLSMLQEHIDVAPVIVLLQVFIQTVLAHFVTHKLGTVETGIFRVTQHLFVDSGGDVWQEQC